MKKLIIFVAVIFLFCSSAYAADYCDNKYNQYINELKKKKIDGKKYRICKTST